MLASYACDPLNTKGRIFLEEPTPFRNEYERDKDRIIRSNAFKRLQYKTQLFINLERDHFRNRLTHSIEVSMVARSIAKNLNLSPDLAECVSLAHDLGHTPFGHIGEEALDSCVKEYGGFSHNAHAFKILTQLERKYASYEGLNLTYEVIEGIIKHNGPIIKNIPPLILEYSQQNNIDLNTNPSLEAQLASLADDIAYVCHDLEDIIKSGLINFDEVSEISFLATYISEVRDKFGNNIESSRLIYEVTRRFITYLISNLITETKANLAKYNPQFPDEVRKLKNYIVAFPESIILNIQEIKQFLAKKVYSHPTVDEAANKGKQIIINLFTFYMKDTSFLPGRWQKLIAQSDKNLQSIIIADYIAGMTDRHAVKLHNYINNKNFSSLIKL